FQRTVRRAFKLAAEAVNAPGAPPQRAPNCLGVDPSASVAPRTLSHVVYFVPDAARAEAFYERLGFRTTDRFIGVGPVLRPAGPFHAPGWHSGSSPAVCNSAPAIHAGPRAFHLPPRRPK